MASSRRAVTILMVSHLYWSHTRCFAALRGMRNQRRATSGRLLKNQTINSQIKFLHIHTTYSYSSIKYILGTFRSFVLSNNYHQYIISCDVHRAWRVKKSANFCTQAKQWLTKHKCFSKTWHWYEGTLANINGPQCDLHNLQSFSTPATSSCSLTVLSVYYSQMKRYAGEDLQLSWSQSTQKR